MIKIDPRLLRESVALRKKVREVEKLEKEVKMRVAFRYLLSEGESYGHALEAVAEFFSASRATVKRAARGLSAVPVYERRRPAETQGGESGIESGRRRPARSNPWLPLDIGERAAPVTSVRRPTSPRVPWSARDRCC